MDMIDRYESLWRIIANNRSVSVCLLVQEVVTHFQWRYLPDLGRPRCGIIDGPAEKHPGRQFGRAPRQQKW